MRLRSLHPSYLDTKGLVALWRETLLAKHVLEGKTKGYTMHPQLDRFKACADPLSAINLYLTGVEYEASQRGYHFDKNKIGLISGSPTLVVTRGQLTYEYQRLLQKLKTRDSHRHQTMQNQKNIASHPLFHIIDGDIAPREKI